MALTGACSVQLAIAVCECLPLSDLVGRKDYSLLAAQRAKDVVLVVPLQLKPTGPVKDHAERCLDIGIASAKRFDELQDCIPDERRATLRERVAERAPAGLIVFVFPGTNMGPHVSIQPATPGLRDGRIWQEGSPYVVRDRNVAWARQQVIMQARCDRANWCVTDWLPGITLLDNLCSYHTDSNAHHNISSLGLLENLGMVTTAVCAVVCWWYSVIDAVSNVLVSYCRIKLNSRLTVTSMPSWLAKNLFLSQRARQVTFE
jgi:hypothetical protein